MTEPARRPSRDADGTLRPWEFPGSTRRDSLPHRGRLLRALGLAAFISGLVAVPTILPALVALPLGLTVRRLAVRDLEGMLQGTIDPAGRTDTLLAQQLGTVAAILGLVGWVPFAMLYLVIG